MSIWQATPTQDLGHVAGIMHQLEAVRIDMASREPEHTQATEDFKRLSRDWDYRLALHLVKAAGGSSEIRKANALVAAIEQDDLYTRLTDAEARFEALKTVTNSLDKQSMALQSLLKAEGQWQR